MAGESNRKLTLGRLVNDQGDEVNSKGNNVDWPLMTPMRQEFDVTTVPDLESDLSMQIRARLAQSRVIEGGSVAVGVGSRGVSPIRRVVSTIVSELKLAGLKPFIVPAMGSHGAARPPGNRKCWSSTAFRREPSAARSAPPWRPISSVKLPKECRSTATRTHIRPIT